MDEGRGQGEGRGGEERGGHGAEFVASVEEVRVHQLHTHPPLSVQAHAHTRAHPP